MSQSISQKFTPITLLKFALPSMVMMIFMSCYTIVDGIFISRYLFRKITGRNKGVPLPAAILTLPPNLTIGKDRNLSWK